MTLNLVTLLERWIQKGSASIDDPNAPDRETLDALEWADTDSGETLKERGRNLREKEGRVGAPPSSVGV
jgi:hypothetical protein